MEGFTKRYHLYYIAALWLAVQLFLLGFYGLILKGEAPKYFDEAGFFLQHRHFSEPKYLFYSTYIFLHVLCQVTGAGITGVYIFQLLLSLLGVFCFYKLASLVTVNSSTGFIATVLLLICTPWQIWTVHLYTESVFLNLVVIFTYLFFKDGKTGILSLATICCFILLFFSRPTAMLLLPAIAVTSIVRYRSTKGRWLLWGIMVASVAAFIFILNYAMKGEGEFDFMKPFLEEHIICGVPEMQQSTGISLPQEGNSVAGLAYYVTHNSSQFFRLAGHKFVAFYGLTRSYYSGAHNFYLVAFFYPLYLLFIPGMVIIWKRQRAFSIYALCLIILFTTSVLLTCDDWLNRFIMPLIPFIILISSAAITWIYRRLSAGLKPTGPIS